jgi:hypothetical protein
MKFKIIGIIPLTNTVELVDLNSFKIWYWKLPKTDNARWYALGAIINDPRTEVM